MFALGYMSWTYIKYPKILHNVCIIYVNEANMSENTGLQGQQGRCQRAAGQGRARMAPGIGQLAAGQGQLGRDSRAPAAVQEQSENQAWSMGGASWQQGQQAPAVGSLHSPSAPDQSKQRNAS